jgi:hypothetical protein
MARPPNVTHSRKLADLCENYGMSDPYRFLYPDSIDFSYQPRAVGNRNRSRLDFFIISEPLLDHLTECQIAKTLQNKLFDHKAVTIDFNKKKVLNTGTRCRPSISNKELNDDLLQYLVKISFAETYLIHSTDDIVNGVPKQNLIEMCGNIRNLIRECGPPLEYILGEQITMEKKMYAQEKLLE